MIKANELRIGNIIMAGGKVTVCEVEDIAKCKRSPALRHGIPLTPEILEKAGFGHNGNLHVYKDFEAGYNNDDFMYGQHSVRIKKSLIVKIKHLHQLQNLYFALTGEELNINP